MLFTFFFLISYVRKKICFVAARLQWNGLVENHANWKKLCEFVLLKSASIVACGFKLNRKNIVLHFYLLMPCARKNCLLHLFPFLTPLRLYFEMLFRTTSIIKVSLYFLVCSHVQLKPCHYYPSNWLQLSLIFSQVFGIFTLSPLMSPYFNLPVQVSSFSIYDSSGIK